MQRFEREDKTPGPLMSDDGYPVFIDVDLLFQVLGWIFLGACFLGLVVGFMAMPEVVYERHS